MTAADPEQDADAAPDPAPARQPDRAIARLLRWYPRAWRERYRDEFLALVEDTLDGRRPGWRLRLGVVRAGLRERWRVLSGPTGKRVLSQWSMFVLGGSLLTGSIDDAGGHPNAAGTWQAVAVLTVLAVLAVVTGAAVVAGGAVAWPSFVGFLQAGGWPAVRRRIIWAAAATVAAAGALAWLVVLQASMTPGQLSKSQAYGNVLITSAPLFVIAIGLWAMAASAVAEHLDLAPRARAAETLLAAVISAGVLTMAPVQITWLGVITSSPLRLANGLALLAASFIATPGMLTRARRRARRQRRGAALHGR
jgi:hypothetical protein